MKKVVFFDRDGTLIFDRIYLNDPEDIEYLPGVFEAMRVLRDQGFSFIVVTNQSGVPRGLVDIKNLDQIHKNMVSKYMMVAIGGLVRNTQYFEKSARDCYRNINNYLANKYPNHSEPVQFEYDINDYTYLVGTYKVIWDSTNRYSNSFTMEGDSTVISVQNGKLFLGSQLNSYELIRKAYIQAGSIRRYKYPDLPSWIDEFQRPSSITC